MTEQTIHTPVDEAVDVVARHLLRKALEQALNFENVSWEDYPDISEAHFEAAWVRAEKLADSLLFAEPVYDAAYGTLSDLAEGDES